jgi:hypothetical protein
MNQTEEQARDQSADDTAELARRATRDVRELIRRETDTFKDEIAENLQGLKRPAVELGIAAVLALSAFGTLLFAIASERRRGVLVLAGTTFGALSCFLGARAVRTAAQTISFARTTEHVERAIDAAVGG